MERYKGLYLTKSFFSVGNSTDHCYNCAYCRANDSARYQFGNILPGEVNDEFKKLPIAVNLFYGDPMLQKDSTFDILKRLEYNGHIGPVIIITKGVLPNKFPKFNLDLHFGLSTFGCDSPYDGSSMERFKNNLKTASSYDDYKFSIEFRPIIRNINDSDECFANVLDLASEYHCGVGYCGLQLSENLRSRLLSEEIVFENYDGVDLGMKKFLPNEIHEKLHKMASERNVNVFKKTSCLLAYTHNLDRDPNAHYYRPNEVGCFNCPLKEKCFTFKENIDTSKPLNIPFDYKIVEKENHTCILFKKGICKFPSYDCTHIKGKLIQIDEPISTSDVRVIKWLYGMTVDAPFTEEPWISDVWNAKNR